MEASKPETAIIIRARNEERWIGEVIDRLKRQTYRDFEIIVVDSGSTDSTLEIVRSRGIKLIEIPTEAFTYPRGINIGIANCTATTYFVILSAHSLPINNTWLESGINKFSITKNVLGIYGPIKALPDGTFWDKLFYGISYVRHFLMCLPRTYKVISKGGMGALGFTNAIIRRDLWEQYPINENFAGGGEDGDWLQHWLQKGYVAVKDMGFAVHHSHYLDLGGWREQVVHWRSLGSPSPFRHQRYRKDGSHNHFR